MITASFSQQPKQHTSGRARAQSRPYSEIPAPMQSKGISTQYCFISVGRIVARIEPDCLFSERTMFDFAPLQFVEQKARKKLISQVRTRELVHGILNSNLLYGHSEYWHNKPPKRLSGSESLAGSSTDSSNLQHSILQREAAGSRLLVDVPARFIFCSLSSGKRVVEAGPFVRFSHVLVHGGRPRPLAVLYGRKDINYVAFVFESFHKLVLSH